MRVLGIAAHPDDLEFGASGAFAKWARSGASCYYLICTDGGKGSDHSQMTERALARIRKQEQLKAGRILGLKGVFFLKHKDTELTPDLTLKREIVRFIRKLRPDIVVAIDPTVVYSKSGFVNHTDHRAAGIATIDAVYPLARDRLAFKDLEKEGLRPHRVKHVYLINFDGGSEIVDISKTIDLKLRALAAHESQVSGKDLGWVKRMARTVGRPKRYRYAERFVKLELW